MIACKDTDSFAISLDNFIGEETVANPVLGKGAPKKFLDMITGEDHKVSVFYD